MITRRTAACIASAYKAVFSNERARSPATPHGVVNRDGLYDFLFEKGFEAWFCNSTKRLGSPRYLKEWVMQLHTGESLQAATPDWDWTSREKLGQRYLQDLAEDFLQWYSGIADSWQLGRYKEVSEALARSLELDGYVFRDGCLFFSEADVLDVQEETGILNRLYVSNSLGQKNEAFQFLALSEEHYMASRWGDCISNVRKFLELTFQETATCLAKTSGEQLTGDFLNRPVEVRKYLTQQGVLEGKEREAVDKIYGLLSHTGGHPYMAERDQARLLRQMGLIVTQFVLLRLEGRSKSKDFQRSA